MTATRIGATAICGDEGDAAEDPMPPAGQKGKAAPGSRPVAGFRQDAATAGDDGIGGEDEIARPVGGGSFRLGCGEAAGEITRKFPAARRLFDRSGMDARRRKTDLFEKDNSAG